MRLLFIRIFALAILTNSILAFGASSPCKDEKMPACPAPAASAPQTNDDEHCAKKMKKEKQMKKKKSDQEKQDDNYPGYGIYG
jgi:hypothetical protein